ASWPGAGRRTSTSVGVHHTGDDPIEERLNLPLILGEDSRRQAVLGVVRLVQRLIERINGSYCHERQKQLALEELVIQRQSIDNRRLDICPVGICAVREHLTAEADGPAIAPGHGHGLLETLDGLVVDYRSDECLALETVADDQLASTL